MAELESRHALSRSGDGREARAHLGRGIAPVSRPGLFWRERRRNYEGNWPDARAVLQSFPVQGGFDVPVPRALLSEGIEGFGNCIGLGKRKNELYCRLSFHEASRRRGSRMPYSGPCIRDWSPTCREALVDRPPEGYDQDHVGAISLVEGTRRQGSYDPSAFVDGGRPYPRACRRRREAV